VDGAGRCGNRTGDLGSALGGDEEDSAVLLRDGRCTDGAGGRDGFGIGVDAALEIDDEGMNRAGMVEGDAFFALYFGVGVVDLDEDVGVVFFGLDENVVAGGEGGVAVRGIDVAVVGDLLGEEGDVAGGAGDFAEVDEGGFARTREVEIIVEEVGFEDVEGGGEKAGGFDAGIGADEDSVRVDEIDLAVGEELAEDGTVFGADDAVENGGVRTWLLEADEFMGVDGEAVPFEDGFLGAGLDEEDIGVGVVKREGAGDEVATVGFGGEGKGEEEEEEEEESCVHTRECKG